MPGENETEKKTEAYNYYMNFANSMLSMVGTIIPFSESTFEQMRQIYMGNIAKAMAYAQMAKENAGPFEDVEGRAAEILKSEHFQSMYGSMGHEQMKNMLVKSVNGMEVETFKYDEFTEKAQEYEETQAYRLGGLVHQLETSTSKSFTGKLKSIFVGNSKQYKAALKAMKDLAGGTVKNPVDMTKAKQAIVDYILVRGGKERDHQYGRDRFDAFMKGLGEVMTPQEFLRCCQEVNKRREATYGNTSYNIKGENYLQGEQLDAFKKEETKELAAERAALHKRNSTAKLRDEEQEKAHATNERRDKIKELAKNEKDRASDDAQRIHNDASSIAKGEKPSSGMTIPERDQYYLDSIRKAANLLKDPNAKIDIDGLRFKVSKRSEEHPAFRLVAQKLIQDKGLTKKFGYQETYTRKMDPAALEALEKQVKNLQEQDREKHPNDPIEGVKVKDRGLKELQKLEKIQEAEDLENKRLEEQADKTKKTTEPEKGSGPVL